MSLTPRRTLGTFFRQPDHHPTRRLPHPPTEYAEGRLDARVEEVLGQAVEGRMCAEVGRWKLVVM